MCSMGKEASLDGLEFDGETVLCRVCGDKASGFHYGVHACEGCKGFFRRSIQQKIQYRPCLKNQQCNIMRVNRNRCQYCRLKKCISVGMSRDAVRFGRVPKKEKARIIEQMQKVNSQSQTNALHTLLQSESDVVQAVINAHRQTCEFSLDRVHKMRENALQIGEYVNCPAQMACPLNNQLGMDSNANKSDVWQDFSESFTPAIKSVVDFAKGIPGFILLNQDDQVTLLKAGTFEVLLVRLACLFDPDTNSMMFTGGRLFKRHSSSVSTGAGFLLDSMFDFAERFNKLSLTDEELGLFAAVVLLSPDRPGLRGLEQVERIQNKLTEALQNIINTNHKEDSTLFAKLLMKTTDLRTLNTLHSEKSIAGQSSLHHATQERREPPGEESDMDIQDTQSIVSGRSSPSDASSNLTLTSSSFNDTASLDSNGAVVMPHRISIEGASHQQVVLRTPYGTFYREEMSGFYGMMHDPPRRRCHTLDRDTLTRPARLHTIEEGNRRRYTMDRDYINKMVNKLSDRLEKRTAIRGDSVPPSMSSSAASSPIPEENYPYLNTSREFVPISTPDTASGGVQRTSPQVDHGLLAFGSSAQSPSPRSRSGSFTAGDDYSQIRPRCYSLHLNSDGRAARGSAYGPGRVYGGMVGDKERISPDAVQYLSPDMRRGSVGASYGLHARKKSLLVDRPPAYLESLRQESQGRLHDPTSLSKRQASELASLYEAGHIHPPNWPQGGPVGLSPPPPLLARISPRQDSSHSPSEPMPTLSKLASQELAQSEANMDDNKSTSGSEETLPESFGHKKFDKLRKHMPQPLGGEEGEGGATSMEEGEGASKMRLLASSPSAGSPQSGEDSNGSPTSDRPKRTAGEAHPNLLAHLKAPMQFQPIQTRPPMTSFPWQAPHQLSMMHPGSGALLREFPPGMSKASPPLSHAGQVLPPHLMMSVQGGSASPDQPKSPSGAPEAAGSKEHIHAAAVSHLKDKLLRKIDSMDNLHKIGSNGTASACKEAGEMKMEMGKSEGQPRSMSMTTSAPIAIPSAAAYSSALPVYPMLSPGYGQMSALGLPPNVNPHLASMQQFAQLYSNSALHANSSLQARAKREEENQQPLNLSAGNEDMICRAPAYSGTHTLSNGTATTSAQQRPA